MNTVDDLTGNRARVLSPPAPADGEKTAVRAAPGRMRHGQVLSANGGVQRVEDGVTVLLRMKGIELGHQAAAERYLCDYMTGIEGVSQSQGERRGGGDIHTTMLARANAVTRVSSIQRAIGRAGTLRLNMLVVEQITFSAMAARLFPGDSHGRTRVQAQCTLVLDQVADLYMELDQQRRPANGNRPKQKHLT